jgi:hypothetical protein
MPTQRTAVEDHLVLSLFVWGGPENRRLAYHIATHALVTVLSFACMVIGCTLTFLGLLKIADERCMNAAVLLGVTTLVRFALLDTRVVLQLLRRFEVLYLLLQV